MFGIQKFAVAFCLVCTTLSFVLPRALGQRDDASTDSAGASGGGPRPVAVEIVKPTIIVIKDKDGRLHPAPDMTLEELQELVRLREERRDPVDVPRFHFTTGSITGEADKEKVSLTLNYSIVVHESRWVRVPLRLGGAIVTHSSFEGQGNHFVEYDEEQSSYYAWIKPEAANQTHHISLQILNRITQVGDEQRLELALPRVVAARDAPRMTLRVPIADAVATATSDSQTCTIVATKQGRNTQLRISQPVGDLSLVWRSTAREAVHEGPVVFDVTSKIVLTWDSQSRVVWDASLSLQALRGQLATIQVRLPPSAKLLVEDFDGQGILADDTDETLAIVELDRPISEGQSREIRLRCERVVAPRDIANVDAIEIGGFQVAGAARQSGYIGVITADSLRANLTPQRNVYRQYEMPEGFHEAGVVGSRTYQFLSQPCEIKMNVAPRRRRIAAAPIYLLRVSEEKLSLTAQVSYHVSGRTLNTCSTIFPGWDIEKVELGEGQADTPLAFDPPTDSTLDIDLPHPMRGEFILRIEASQTIPEEADFFAVNLPSFDADSLEAPQLVVISDEDLEVLQDADRSAGVVQSDDDVPFELPHRHQRPRLYHVAPQPDASFAATIIRHQQEVAVTSEATIRLTKSSVSLLQQLHYDVRYQPLLDLPVVLPTRLAQNDSLQLSIDGEPYREEVSATPTGEGGSLLTLALPEPRLGRVTLTIRYNVHFSDLIPGNETASSITLATPRQGTVKVRGSEATIEADEDLRVELNDDAWSDSLGQFSENTELMRLKADTLPSRVEFLVTHDEQRTLRSSVVERTWVQTWLTNRERQDRAVFRIRTNEDTLNIQLPDSAVLSELMVLLDGQGVPVQVDSQRNIVLRLLPAETKHPIANPFRRHVVEIGWHRDQRLGALDRVQFDMPTVAGAWSQQVRWHVLTPKNRLILFPPSGMAPETSESPWWWLRQPRLTQHELEQWSGATAQPSAESAEQTLAQRQYLFAGVGRVDESEIVSCSAALAMLAVCAVAFGLIAIVVYVPRVRHPSLLLALSVAMAYLAFRWPTAGLFAGQTVGIALIVVLASQLLQRIVLRHRRREPRGSLAVSATGERPSTRIRSVAPPASSPSTTTQATGPTLPLTPSESP